MREKSSTTSTSGTGRLVSRRERMDFERVSGCTVNNGRRAVQEIIRPNSIQQIIIIARRFFAAGEGGGGGRPGGGKHAKQSSAALSTRL